MNDSKLVVYQEPLSIRVSKHLLTKGFRIATPIGIISNYLFDTSAIGVLSKNFEGVQKYFFSFIRREPRRIFLGTIWLENSLRGTNQWVFEVYGRKNLDLVVELANDISSTFNVPILVKLVYED